MEASRAPLPIFSPSMKRLFFGLSVDPTVGSALIRAARRSLEERDAGGIYGEDDLHLTLTFVGDFPEDRVKSLIAAANYEFKALWAPELLVGGEGGGFPDSQRPKALFSPVEETGESVGRLAALRNRTHQVAMSHGWRASSAERRRAFRPHVTLARVDPGRPGAQASDYADFWDLGAERRWLPLDITLYESDTDPNKGLGDRYRQLAAWPLAVRPG